MASQVLTSSTYFFPSLAADTAAQRRHLLWAVVFSIALHVVALIFRVPEHSNPAPIPVSFVTLKPPLTPERQNAIPAIPVPERQFVSPSQAPEATPPKSTRLLSDRDTFTPHEQIRRGVPEGGTGNAKQQQAASEKSAAAHRSPQTHPPALRLDDAMLAKKFSNETKSTAVSTPETKTQPEKNLSLEDYQPFQRGGGLQAFTGPLGTPDYLPNIPDGDVTLLNAKADRFAIFVRRVALQVFSSLRQRHWQQLTASQVHQIRDYALIEAVMSPSGKLLRTAVLDRSGNERFDSIVLESATSGTWDQNPPPAAVAEDGNIHFIFRARTWSRPGMGRSFEQRWLLLGTALR